MKQRLGVIGALAAASLLVAGGALASTAANAHDATVVDDKPVPRDQRSVPSEGTWLKSEDMVGAVAEAQKQVGALLPYPSSDSRFTSDQLTSNATFDLDGLYEDGIQDQIVLDEWTCSWALVAKEASESGDTAGVADAGHIMLKRIDYPGQRELQPDWDRMVAEVYAPLLEGDYEAVSDYWGFQCAGTHGAEFNEPAGKW